MCGRSCNFPHVGRSWVEEAGTRRMMEVDCQERLLSLEDSTGTSTVCRPEFFSFLSR